jgi:N-hydroxyarylamine O-acetyltransferase
LRNGSGVGYSDSQISAYFARIGAGEAGSSLGALNEIHRAHRLAIPFENLDIPLGAGIDLGSERLFNKLVTGRRGGYCFEQNALFLGMLQALGFEARPLLARIWLRTAPDDPVRRAPTRSTWSRWTGPITSPTPASAAATPRLCRSLRTRSPPVRTGRAIAWSDTGNMAGCCSAMPAQAGSASTVSRPSRPIRPIWRSPTTSPRRARTRGSPGIGSSAACCPDGTASLVDRQLTISHSGSSDSVEVAGPDEYRQILAELFGLDLTREEVSALALF